MRSTSRPPGRCTVEERLARWLLMARDRIDTDEVFLTHESLPVMLGVRRASITETLRGLAEDDLIAIKEARSRSSTGSGCKSVRTALTFRPNASRA